MRDDKKTNNMANEILIIGVGSAGVIAADKMDLPNSKKLFIDRDSYILKDAKSEGNKIKIVCKDRDKCPSLHCGCFDNLDFCKKVAEEYEEEIRECIKNAFMEE